MLSKLGHIIAEVIASGFEVIISSAISSSMQGVIKKGRKTLFVIVLSFIFSLLFSAGIIISLLEITSQTDANGFVYFSSKLSWSLILSGISVSGLGIIFWPRSFNPSKAFSLSAASNSSLNNSSHAGINSSQDRPNSPRWEDLLGVLIAEGVHYLKEKNQTKSHDRPVV